MKTMKKALALLLSVMMIAGTVVVGLNGTEIVAEAADKTIYVATTGSDVSGDGTQAKPLATLQAALDMASPSDNTTIQLAAGTYFVDKTIDISGASNITVSGSGAVISGGYEIPTADWKTATLNGQSCFAAEIPYDIVSEMVAPVSGRAQGVFTAYLGEKKLVNSRFPNDGYLKVENTNSNYGFITDTTDTSWLSDEALSGAFIRMSHKWIGEVSRMETYDPSTGGLTFVDNFGIAPAKGEPYCFENVKHGFDKAGEWYFDYASCKIYYLSSSAPTGLTIGRLDTLMSINSSSNVTFSGVRFENTDWTYYGYRTQSALDCGNTIAVKASSGINFTGCEFRNLGNNAVGYGRNMNDGRVTKSTVSGCKFTNIGASAVFAGAGSTAETRCEEIDVTDCLISGYGQNYRQATAVLFTKVYDCEITHNEIHDGSYSGVSVGWNWGFMSTVTDYNKVNNNLIYNIGHDSICDLGGIYFLGIQQNSEIKNNVVFGVDVTNDVTTEGAWGIYLDEGSTGVDVMNNIVHDCGGEGFHQHYGYNNVIENNIFAFNRASQVRSSADKTPSAGSPVALPGAPADISRSSGDDNDKLYYHNATDGLQFTLEKNILVADNGYMYGSLANASHFKDNNNLYYDYTRGDNVMSMGALTTKAQVTGSGKTNDYSGASYSKPFSDTDAQARNFANPTAKPSGFTNISTANVGSSTYGSAARYNLIKLKTLDESYYYCGPLYDAYKTALIASNDSVIASDYNDIDNGSNTITLDAQGGTLSSGSSTITYNGISTVNLPTVTKDGDLFVGWMRSTDNAFISSGEYKAGSGSYTLTAVFENRPTPVNSTDGKSFVYFDNYFRFCDVALPGVSHGQNNVNINTEVFDFASNSFKFTTTGSNAFAQWTNVITLEANRKYKISYDYYVNGAKRSNTRMTILFTDGIKDATSNGYTYADTQNGAYENWASGEVLQYSETKYIALRMGAPDGSTNVGDVVEYRNICIQDVTEGRYSTRTVPNEIVRVINTNSAIGGNLPTETCRDKTFLGWNDIADASGNEVTAATTVSTKSKVVYPVFDIKREDQTPPAANLGLKIEVPETIYLNPSDNKTFQYFVNNTMTSGGTVSLDASATASTGNYYFRCPGVSGDVTVKLYDGSTEIYSGSITLTNGFGSGSIGRSQKLNAAISASTSKELKWVFTYNGGSATVYSTAYAPYQYPVFAATRARSENGDSSSDVQSMAWISGVHSVDSGNRGSNPSMFSPINNTLTLPTAASSSSKVTGEMITQDNGGYHYDNNTPKTGYFESYDKSDTPEESQAISPEGHIIIDSSRISNMNQVPNFEIGYLISYVAECSSSLADRWFGYYLSDFSSVYSTSTYPSSSGSHGTHETGYTNNRGTVLVSDTSKENSGSNVAKEYCYPRLVYDNSWNKPINSSTTVLAIKGAARFGAKNDADCDKNKKNSCANDSNIVHISLTQINKTDLRNKVDAAINCGLAADTNSEYYSVYVNACKVLGQPDALQSDVTIAYNAISTAVSEYRPAGKSGAVQVQYNLVDTATHLADTETKDYYAPATLTAYAKTIPGYKLCYYTIQKGSEYVASAATTNPIQSYTTDANCQSVTFVFYYEPDPDQEYHVRFFDGNSQVGSTQDVLHDTTYNTLSAPANQTPAGYTFIGWNTESGLLSDVGSAKITHSQDIYAVYKLADYKIIFDPNYGSGAAKANILLAPTTVVKTGNGLTVSYDAADNSFTVNGRLPDGVTTRTIADFPINNSVAAGDYRVVIDQVDGSISSGNWDGVINFNCMSSDNSKIKGTYLVKTHINNPSATGNGVLKLTSDDIANTAYISMEAAAREGTYMVFNNYKFRVKIESNTAEYFYSPYAKNVTYNKVAGDASDRVFRTGYTFSSWNTKADGTGTGYNSGTYTATANTTYYAQWTANTYKVRFNANGGSGSIADESFTYDQAKALTANGFTRAGYHFLGWSNSASGDKVYNNLESVSNLTTTNGAIVPLYAKWDINKYNIAFNANGGTGTAKAAINNVEYNAGANLGSNPYSKVGYVFGGWAKSADGAAVYSDGATATNVYDNIATTDGQTVTLYANWLKLGINNDIALAGKEIGSKAMFGEPGTDGWSRRRVIGITPFGSSLPTGYSTVNNTSDGIENKDTTLTGRYGNLIYSSAGQNVTYMPYKMDWKNITDFKDPFYLKTANYYTINGSEQNPYYGYEPLNVYPQTNVLYETPESTTAADAGNGKLSNGDVSNAWTQIVQKEAGADAVSSSTVYGYSDLYSKADTYSGGYAMKATVSEADYNAIAADNTKQWPTYRFKMTGTGFDINTSCDADSGLLTVGVYTDSSYSTMATYTVTNPKTGQLVTQNYSKAINTYYSPADKSYASTLYQTPVVHFEGLPWGEYFIECKVSYNKAFDKGYVKPSTTGGDYDDGVVFFEENGVTYADLSSFLGENYSKVEMVDDLCEAPAAPDGAILTNLEPAAVGGETTGNAYSVTIDSVRVYNPAGVELSAGDNGIGDRYTADEELNPTYSNLRANLLTAATDISSILSGDNSSLYIEKKTQEDDITTTETSTYKRNGSVNEIYLTTGSAIGLDVGSPDRVHLAMRSPEGKPITVLVGTGTNQKTFNINSATELYYDVTECVEGNSIAVTLSTGKLVAIGGLKTFESETASAPARISPKSFSAARDLLTLSEENPLNKPEEMTFTVDFGDAGKADVTVASEKVMYELVDNKWVASLELTAEEVAALFNENADTAHYSLDAPAAITVKATQEEDGWTAVEEIVTTNEIVPEIGATEFTVKFGDEASETITVEDLNVEKVNGVWTATAAVSADDISALFEKTGKTEDYRIVTAEDKAATAKYIDDEWVINDIVVEIEEIPAPAAEDVTFTIDLGEEYGTVTVTVPKDKFSCEKVDGVWTATAEITVDELADLIAKAGLSDKIKADEPITVTAESIDGEWTAEKVNVTVSELPDDPGQGEDPGTDEPGQGEDPGTDDPGEKDEPWYSWIIKLIKKIIEFFKILFERIKLAISGILN